MSYYNSRINFLDACKTNTVPETTKLPMLMIMWRNDIRRRKQQKEQKEGRYML